MAIKFIMVSHVFLKHKNHPIVGVFYTNYLLNQPTRRQLLSPTSIYQQNLLVSLWKRIASTSLTPTGSASINGLLKK